MGTTPCVSICRSPKLKRPESESEGGLFASSGEDSGESEVPRLSGANAVARRIAPPRPTLRNLPNLPGHLAIVS